MGRFAETRHGSQGSARCMGTVSGFTLKMVRESIGLTQVQLARDHEVDVATIQGWESGRRPLAALRVRDLARLRARLLRSSASSAVIRALDDAIYADLILSDCLEAGRSPIPEFEHLLGSTAHQRTLTTQITWPLTGEVPCTLTELSKKTRSRQRRGPVSSGPSLSVEEKNRFFDHLMVTAETSRRKSLLRRQAIYLLGFDVRDDTIQWLRDEQLKAIRGAIHHDDVPSWVSVRSSAVALASAGDPDPLTRFVRKTLVDDRQARANLNYWAYWVGEIEAIHVDDRFMIGAAADNWSGVRLMAHLADRLSPESPLLEMHVHTMWSLLMLRPDLLRSQDKTREIVKDRAIQLHDIDELRAETRRELSDITYAARSAST